MLRRNHNYELVYRNAITVSCSVSTCSNATLIARTNIISLYIVRDQAETHPSTEE